MVKVMGQSSRSREENGGSLIGATSSEGFLASLKVVLVLVSLSRLVPSLL